MDTDSRDFGLFIDGLRLERNMSREDLCEGVMSLSQYKRYLRGDTSIPNNRLVQIADRLKFSISDIHILYQKRHGKQLQEIERIYNLMLTHKYQEAYDLASNLRHELFISEYNKLYYDFCYVYVQHALNMVSDIHVLDLYSRMINYPNCKDNESFNWVEMNILFQITRVSSVVGNYEPAEIMYKILTSDSYNISVPKSSNLLPNIYLIIGQILGQQSKYDQVVEITDRGIEHCRKYGISFALSSLFMINAFAKLDAGNKEDALVSARMALMQLQIDNKPQKLEQLKTAFKSKFNIDIEEFISS